MGVAASTQRDEQVVLVSQRIRAHHPLRAEERRTAKVIVRPGEGGCRRCVEGSLGQVRPAKVRDDHPKGRVVVDHLVAGGLR